MVWSVVEREEIIAKQSGLITASLVYREKVTDDLVTIRIRPDVPVVFRPGQYCTVGYKGIERAYSIVSAPHEYDLELFVEILPESEGVLTPLLGSLDLGSKLTLRPKCKGIFTLDKKYFSHLMISTVTGIAPYISILRDYFYLGATGHKFHVLQGASYMDEFVYKTEMENMVSVHSESVFYVPTVSRLHESRNVAWEGYVGRVNNIFEGYIERMGLEFESTLVYTCGHPGMINSVKELAQPKGFKVKEERFWKD